MTDADGGPWRLASPGGLSALVVDGGGLASLMFDDVELVQHAASVFEPGLVQLWVRDRTAGVAHPLLGPASASAMSPPPAPPRADFLAAAPAPPPRADFPAAAPEPPPRADFPAAPDVPTLRWQARLVLHPTRPAWAWHVAVTNGGTTARDVDVLHTHDVALSELGALRANELYVSQYLDLTPLDGPTGTALAVRQNLPQSGRHPWCLLAADRQVAGWATDVLDVHAWAGRSGTASGPVGDLPSRRRQHEHSLAALQTTAATLGPGEQLRVTFAGLLLPDHPAATSSDDVDAIGEALALAAEALSSAAEMPSTAAATAPSVWSPTPGPRESSETAPSPAANGHPVTSRVVEAVPGARGVAGDGEPREGGDLPGGPARRAPSGPYDQGRELTSSPLDLDALRARWPEPWRAVERDESGDILSFFAGDEHVVTRAKELTVLRPHGTILRTGDAARPDPDGLTVTAWMTGSPLSYLTRGHATTGRVLTMVRGYLGLHRAYGLRVLVEVAGVWRLLDLPSAFAMTTDSARWVYVLEPGGGDDGGVVDLRTVVPASPHQATVRLSIDGAPRRVLLALHLATEDEPLPARPHSVRTDAIRGGAVVHVRGPGGSESALVVHGSAPTAVGDDSPLFDDGRSRTHDVVTLMTEPVTDGEWELRVPRPVEGARREDTTDAGTTAGGPADVDVLGSGADAAWWPEVTAIRVDGDEEAESLAVSLPWLVRDALVHYLSPRGLEQYTGGAWGTRDVTQGPLELLLALDRLADARALLLTVFEAQNTDGSWPQAFGFLPGDEHFRHEPPHGDVVHWPVLALGRYLLASGDRSVLDEPVSWYTGTGPGNRSALLDHVDRALDHARSSFLPGTHLVAYGHGDWNDSLQPADPSMTTTMASAWTVTLHHQALRALADGLEASAAAARHHDGDGEPGRPSSADPARRWPTEDPGARVPGFGRRVTALRAEATAVAQDLERYLLVDGELAGYAQLGPPGDRGEVTVRRYLVHPRDRETGLRHGSLQIIHALGDDLFPPELATRHVALVREHLMGADGVRLFDRPPAYRGGEMHHFQRAETATFVGREIGLMYVHAHLRWCEAMARWGDPEALWLGIRQTLAPAVPDVVPGARRRQANTYASSSDAAVLDRADFAARYDQVLTGGAEFEAGWRIYSSGPGVLVRIITQSLLGVRRRGRRVGVDPVLPTGLDGLTATVPLDGGHLRLRYHVGARGHGVERLHLGDRAVDGERTPNPYREGGLLVDLADLADALAPDGPELAVHLR